ncbi:MAG: hypothetical protein WKF42_08825 [Solirubrobacteraceae bacterium]
MSRKATLALVAYVLLLASLATPLYEPLSAGRDDSGALLVLLVGAHVGVGIIVRRAWVLLLPLALAVAGFVLNGAAGLAWVILVFGGPLLIAVTALGWLLGHSLKRRAAPVALAVFIIAAAPAAWAVGENAKRGPHVSAREQRELPTTSYALVQDLCFDGDSRFDRKYAHEANPRARRQFAVLEQSLRIHPNAVVRVRFTPADSPRMQTRELTVLELAETHLEGARLGGLPDTAACYRSGRARLERLLEAHG